MNETLVCDGMRPMNKLPNPNDCYTEHVCQTYMVATPCSHDGIVTLPSQEGLAGATKKLIPKTNHEEVKRSIEVVSYLVSQFEESTGYFKLDKK